jgi:dTDP-glucose pyrophosphorylase
MKNWKQHIISEKQTVKQALEQLNDIGIPSNVLYVVGDDGTLKGSLTDGDIRRGLLKDGDLADIVTTVMNANCFKAQESEVNSVFVKQCLNKGIQTIPVISSDNVIIDILALYSYRDFIPVDAVIMAGGKGERLLPLTKEKPKPLLPVGDKPIIEHNIDRLIHFGVQHVKISVNYLADQLIQYFGDGESKNIRIEYLREEKALGTIGSLSYAESFSHDVILVMNSDLLTNIEFGDFYHKFMESGADLAVATTPHYVDLPYGIIEFNNEQVSALKEKPRYVYFANAGIYLMKREVINYLPKGEFYNATDLLERLLVEGRKVIHYPILGYWLDIGRMSDYIKAQEDIKFISL